MRKIIPIIIGFLMIISYIQIITHDESITGNATAESSWTETDWLDSASYEKITNLDPDSNSGEVILSSGTDFFVADKDNCRIVKTKMGGVDWATFGVYGTGDGQFKTPYSVSYDNTTGYIYAVDPNNNRIVKTKMDGTGWTTLGGFEAPAGICYDSSSDYIYVTETGKSRIVKTKIDGTGWTTYGSYGVGKGLFNIPWGISYDKNTDYIYVTDMFNHRIVRTKINGTGWKAFGTEGTGYGKFDHPHGIYVDSNTGFIYIGDCGNDRIIKTKIDGSGWTAYGTSGEGVGKFQWPIGICYDSNTDYVYVIDTSQNHIVKTKMDGSGWETYGIQGSSNGQFNNPYGICLSEGYYSKGFLRSIKYNCSKPSNFKTISWDAVLPPSTSIKFQLRTAQNSSYLQLKEFVGPGGDPDTYYTTSGTSIWEGHKSDIWIQYRVYLETTDPTKTPILKDIAISYNCIPNTPMLLYPNDDEWINENSPTFLWTYGDADSLGQMGFQWQVDDDSSFDSIEYESQDLSSTEHMYKPTSPINDGKWYWRVRNKDSDGDWSLYSDYRVLKIDTTSPKPFNPKLYDEGWISTDQPTLTFVTTDEGSGIDHYELSVDEGAFSTQTSPYLLPRLANGMHNITVRAYDLVGNHVYGYVNIFIDITLPEKFTPTANPNYWSTNNQPQITFSTTDTDSGIDYYEVGIDFKDFSEQTSPYILPEQSDGIHTVTVRVYDLAKNIREENVNVYIDTTPPNEFVPTVEPGVWISNDQPEISFNASDAISGIDHYEVKLNNDAFSIQKSPYTLPVLAEGINNVTVRAYDFAGNYRDSVVKIYIDTYPPNIIHNPITDCEKGVEIKITATAVDEGSGIDKVNLHYKRKGEMTTYSTITMGSIEGTYSATIPNDFVTSNIEYYIEVIDRSSPSNIIYYGKNGATNINPTSETDIDIQLKDSDNGEISDSLGFWIGTIIIIIIVVFIIIFIFMRKKKSLDAAPPSPQDQENLHQEPQQYNSSTQYSPSATPSQQLKQSYYCEKCGRSITNPNQCNYCGWLRQDFY